MFEFITPISYLILTALWLVILGLYLGKLKQVKAVDRTIAVLLTILAIDAFRTVFESIYFGLYFNSQFGLIPIGFYDILSKPALVIVPKLINLIAGFLVLFLLIQRWVPKEIHEREEALENLLQEKNAAEEKEATLQSILNANPDAIVFTDSERRIVSINKGMDLVFGYGIDDLVGKTTTLLYESHEEYQRQGRIRFNPGAEDKLKPYEVSYRRKDGITFIGETLGTVVKSVDGQILGFIEVIKDISERKKNEEKLKLAANVFTHTREGIMITDANASILEVNDTYTEITGYSREELIGQNPRILQSGRQSSDYYTAMWQEIITTGHWTGEIWNRSKSGKIYAELKNISAVYDENGVIQSYVAMCSDITTIREYQDKLVRNAHYDPLTNLPNRVLLADRLSHAMVQCQQHQQSLAVVFLDLDSFKAVNDTYGHDVGDEMLFALSQHMKEALHEGDTLSRFGGDEFVAVLSGLDNIEDCQPVLERLLKAVATPVSLDGAVMKVSASIGITLYPQDGGDAEQLIRHADQAMYEAKQAGKNRYHLFDTAQDEAVKTQRENMGDIRLALERQEFVLYYQPKVNMHTGKVIGVEALIRWQHPVQGLFLPFDFLPTIEGHDISLEVGEWVVNTALSQISEWQIMGIHLPISVNISAHQLQQDNFSDRLAELLAAHPEVNPHDFELEVLETSALSDISQVTNTMNACSNLGVGFAIDDFGTGYSSLTYLRRLPVGMIKIDQSFVCGMLEDADDLAIIEGVIGLAKSFKREVIAEGVETTAHGTALLKLGCELAQGHGIAMPMPADAIPEWLNVWKPDGDWQN